MPKWMREILQESFLSKNTQTIDKFNKYWFDINKEWQKEERL